MGELHYDFVRDEKKTEILCSAECSMDDMFIAIGRLIQKMHDKTSPKEKSTFKAAIQALVQDDSPIWEPMNGVCIDLKELRRQMGEVK